MNTATQTAADSNLTAEDMAFQARTAPAAARFAAHAASLRISVSTLEAMLCAFVDWAATRWNSFCAYDVALALDGDVQTWESVLFHQRMDGNIVMVSSGQYKVSHG